jgi:hypothetical protein
LNTSRTAVVPGRLRLIVAAIAINSIASLSIILQPAVIEEFVSRRGLTESAAGLIATVEMAIMAIVMILWTRFNASPRLLSVAVLGAAMLAAASIGSMVVDSTWVLLLVRMLAAVGFGLLSLVATMAIADLPDAGALYGLMFTVSLVCTAAIVALLPTMADWFERPAAFPASLLCTGLLMPLVLLMPWNMRFLPRPVGTDSRQAASQRAIFLLAAAISLLAIVYYDVWAFFMVLAGKAGLSVAQASETTAFSLCGAIAGSLLSGYATRLIGSTRLIAMSVVILTVCLLFMVMGWNANAFRIAGFLALSIFYLMFPAVMGSAAQIDPTGNGAALISGCGMLFGAVGPYLGGLLIQLAGPSAQATVTVVGMSATLLLFYRAGIGGGRVIVSVE